MLRLKKLWVKNYKNLKDLTIDFEQGDGFSMLIGTNGSGKSNVLEFISSIFYDVYSKKKTSKTIAYDMEYTINEKDITLQRRGNDLFGTVKHEQDNVKKDKTQLVKDNLLPKNIIAVYSGEETRLWNEFYHSYYQQYMDKINDPSHHTDNMKLMYINKYYWDISLILLLLSERENVQTFLKDTLRLPPVTKITFQFNKNNLSKHNKIIQSFVNVIMQNKTSISYTLEEIREKLFEFEAVEHILFSYFVQAYLPKNDKIINSIHIKFDSKARATDLSEGEKKLILVKAVLEFLADERTLLLFDEPDSHINESKKAILYNIMKEHTTSQIIMTTHSPTLTKLAKSNEKIILQSSENGNTSVVECNDLEAIEKIGGGLWTADAESIIFISQKPLILVEGIGDINYITHAIKILSENEPKYKAIDCEFLPMGGADNAINFIEQLKKCIRKTRLIIVIFDRDDTGCKGFNACLNTHYPIENIQEVYTYDDIFYFLLPKTVEHTGNSFVIEDYFLNTKKVELVSDIITTVQNKGNFNAYGVNLKQALKTKLEKFNSVANASDLEGFRVLLDKIYDIIKGTAEITTIANPQKVLLLQTLKKILLQKQNKETK